MDQKTPHTWQLLSLCPSTFHIVQVLFSFSHFFEDTLKKIKAKLKQNIKLYDKKLNKSSDTKVMLKADFNCWRPIKQEKLPCIVTIFYFISKNGHIFRIFFLFPMVLRMSVSMPDRD